MTYDYAARAKDRAQYTLAVQPHYHQHAGAPAASRGGLPATLPGPDPLDFLAPSCPLFHVDKVLMSAAHYIGGSTPRGVVRKGRPGVMVIGDSGGYSIATGALPWNGDATRAEVLAWQVANVDVAVTLDIPLLAISNGVVGSFGECLDLTVENLRYTDDRRPAGLRLLNVVQGRTLSEALVWLDAVRWFPCDGWAIGGSWRLNFHDLALFMVRLAQDGLLGGGRNHVHVLGTSDLEAAVLLTALKRSMSERVGEDLLFTFDSATPSHLMSYGRVALGPKLSAKDVSLQDAPIPNDAFYVGSQVPFPSTGTALSRRLLMGDICVSRPPGSSNWDALSQALIVNHNFEALLSAIDFVNSAAELRSREAEKVLPVGLIRGYRALREMYRNGDVKQTLTRQQPFLTTLATRLSTNLDAERV